MGGVNKVSMRLFLQSRVNRLVFRKKFLMNIQREKHVFNTFLSYVDQESSVCLYFNPACPVLEQEEKINLNYFFHTSLWGFKRFYEGL